MTTVTPTPAIGSAVGADASDQAEKIVQRIFPARLSDCLKERRMADPDVALVLQSQNGSTAAFEALVRNHQRMIHSLTYRMTGSVADAEDLAQETFIRAHEQIETFRTTAKFSTWLYRIAVNVCLNWRQRESRRQDVYAHWAASTKCFSPEADTTDDDLSCRAQAALLKLPAKQRAAMVLTVYDGLNHAEAAQILGCLETTVSWRVFAARTKLKRWLTKTGAER